MQISQNVPLRPLVDDGLEVLVIQLVDEKEFDVKDDLPARPPVFHGRAFYEPLNELAPPLVVVDLEALLLVVKKLLDLILVHALMDLVENV